jgi:tRNA(fMet)-specific endonuclease VapC
LEVKSILVDTNAYSAFKRGEPDAIEIVNAAGSVAISVIVLGELMAGFRLGSRRQSNLHALHEFLAGPGVYTLPIDSTIADSYSEIFAHLRKSGTPNPTNDIWIAATAIQHHLTLFTFDSHFARVPDLSAGRTPLDFEL